MPPRNIESYFPRFRVPPGAPRARGLRNGRRKPQGRYKRQKVGNKRIKYLKKSDMGRIALDAALALKTLKQHEPVVTTSDSWHTTASASETTPDRALVVHPFFLDRSATMTEINRETNAIYLFNCRGQFEVKPLSTNCETYQLRFVMGYSKGNPDASAPVTPLQGAQGPKLSALLQTEEDTLDPDHYIVLEDKIYNHSPKQIYNDHVTPIAGGQENFVSRANWKPFKRNFNMKFNKKVQYDGASGDDALGDIPFIALMLYQQHDTTGAYTGHTGAHPSPRCKLDQHTFFKDC